MSTSGPEKGGGGDGEDRGEVIEGVGMLTQKWIMAPSTMINQTTLSEGCYFGKVRREELEVVISRTDTPRTEETLARLGCLALR